MWHYREIKSHKMSANNAGIQTWCIVLAFKNSFSKSRNWETQMASFVLHVRKYHSFIRRCSDNFGKSRRHRFDEFSSVVVSEPKGAVLQRYPQFRRFQHLIYFKMVSSFLCIFALFSLPSGKLSVSYLPSRSISARNTNFLSSAKTELWVLIQQSSWMCAKIINHDR